MHTVKSRENIKEAYFNCNIKAFSLDTKDELIKIIEATNQAKDLELFVRVAVSNEHAEIDLSKKFGALTSEAIGLLRLTKQYAKKVGLSFHVGSQCMHPNFLFKRNCRYWKYNKKNKKLFLIILILVVDFLLYILILYLNLWKVILKK